MRLLTTLLGSPEAVRLGLVLLHFVWQGAALGAVAWIGLAALRKAEASVRYAFLLGVLALMVVCPVSTFFLLRSQMAAPAGQAIAMTVGAQNTARVCS